MKKTLHILSVGLLSLSVLLSACGPAPVTSSGDVAESKLERISNPVTAPDDVPMLVAGNTAFALDLYRSLRASEGNLFYSPFSISLALAMTYAGAKGDTAVEMAKAMEFTLPPDKLHPAFNALDQSLESAVAAAGAEKDSEPFQLSIVNSLWGQKDWSFLQGYLDLLAQNYGAGMRLVDYRNDAEQARQQINEWVAGQTKDRIKDLIPAGALDPLTTLVLVNAIYFKAGWEYKFSQDLTHDDAFTLADGSKVTVPMMQFDEPNSLKYAAGGGWQAVSLPYDGGTTEMLLLLPDAGKFDAFEQSLDEARLREILGSLETRQVMLTMPKFSFTDEHMLSGVLSSLGMKKAFDPNQADLSGMDGKRDLYISEVIHKAFVNVDENGTEAAAATAVIIRATALLLPDVEMKVDRPFIFAIRDSTSGSILFFGRVMNPAG